MQVTWFLCTTLFLQAADAPAASSPAPLESSVTAPGPDGQNAAQQMAPAILSSIRTNSERLQGAELSLNRTLIDTSVKEETTIEEPLPNGGKIVTRVRPQHSTVERVVVLEDRIRVDRGGAATSPALTYWFDGVRWTKASTSTRRVAKMHRSQLGSTVLDPREHIGLDHRTSLAAILSQPALKDATVESVDSVTRITTTANTADQKFVVDFDSRYAMLPTRSRLFYANGALARDVAVTYTWMEPRSAWAVEGITERIYDESVDGLGAPEKWRQQLITTATCSLLDRNAAEQLLAPQIPDGYEVVDYTDPATMQPRRAPRRATPLATAESPLKWFILAHVVVAAFAAAYYWRRRSTSTV